MSLAKTIINTGIILLPIFLFLFIKLTLYSAIISLIQHRMQGVLML